MCMQLQKEMLFSMTLLAVLAAAAAGKKKNCGLICYR